MLRRYFLNDPMSVRCQLFEVASAVAAQAVAPGVVVPARHIVTPGTIDAHVEAERKRKEDGDEDGTAHVEAPRPDGRDSSSLVDVIQALRSTNAL